jgi:hypothetical protein
LLVLFSSGLHGLQAQNILSPNAEISLITCDPGSELYSTFGHTAVRIKDELENIDYVFNYGIFDFNTPGFYLKFLRGKLNYRLGFTTFKRFAREYDYQERGLTEQVLNLKQDQKEEIYAFLLNNAKPENRDYKYDFFFDNCSTRPRDVFVESLEMSFPTAPSEITYRNILDEFLPGLPWSDFGIDIVIGAIADKKASYRTQCFIPDYLKMNLENQNKKFVKSSEVILDFSKEREERFIRPWFTPLLVFGILFILELCIFFFLSEKLPRLYRAYDILWFILLGFASLNIIFLWFFTDHMATKQNWNLIWMNPFNFYLAYILVRDRETSVAFLFSAVIVVFTLVGFIWFPQQLHIAFIPILGISLLKSLKYIFKNTTKSV